MEGQPPLDLNYGVTIEAYRLIEPRLTRPLSLGPRTLRPKNPLDGLDIVLSDEFYVRKDLRGF
jgi:hypothetical protein